MFKIDLHRQVTSKTEQFNLISQSNLPIIIMRTVKKKKLSKVKRKRFLSTDIKQELSQKAKEQLQEFSNNLFEFQSTNDLQVNNLHGWISDNSLRKSHRAKSELKNLNKTTNFMQTDKRRSVMKRPQSGIVVEEMPKRKYTKERPARYRSEAICPFNSTMEMRRKTPIKIISRPLWLNTPCNSTPGAMLNSSRSPLKNNVYIERLRPKGRNQIDLGRTQGRQSFYIPIGKAKTEANQVCLLKMSSRLKRTGCPPKKYIDYMSRINRLISQQRVGLIE